MLNKIINDRNPKTKIFVFSSIFPDILTGKILRLKDISVPLKYGNFGGNFGNIVDICNHVLITLFSVILFIYSVSSVV